MVMFVPNRRTRVLTISVILHDSRVSRVTRARLRACLETTRGAVFGEKAGWRGATKEALRAATTEQLRKHSRAGRSETAFSAKTLRAAGLLSVAGVGSFLTARCGALRAAKAALATAKIPRRSALVVSKQALRLFTRRGEFRESHS